jgi:hypothetical protein
LRICRDRRIDGITGVALRRFEHRRFDQSRISNTPAPITSSSPLHAARDLLFATLDHAIV